MQPTLEEQIIGFTSLVKNVLVDTKNREVPKYMLIKFSSDGKKLMNEYLFDQHRTDEYNWYQSNYNNIVELYNELKKINVHLEERFPSNSDDDVCRRNREIFRLFLEINKRFHSFLFNYEKHSETPYVKPQPKAKAAKRKIAEVNDKSEESKSEVDDSRDDSRDDDDASSTAISEPSTKEQKIEDF